MTSPPHADLDLSNDRLELELSTARGIELVRWGTPGGMPWATRSSEMFAVTADGERLTGRDPAAVARRIEIEESGDAGRHAVIALGYQGRDVAVDFHIVRYDQTALVEQWVTVRNAGSEPLRIERIDSFALRLPPEDYRLDSFRSGWGAEFQPVSTPLAGPVFLESRSGRSSNGMAPFFTLRQGEEILAGAVAWSGNWVVRLEPGADGFALSGGLHDWQFFTDLLPGEEVEAPHIMLAAARGDLNAVSQQYHRVGRRAWYPRNRLSQNLPLEWNHWWSYEDTGIDEERFRANVDAAADLGLELCTLDAGWFGASDAGAHWYGQRGDWDRVNLARFPSGIEALSRYAHERKLRFGLWCEIEGLGQDARLGQEHPEFAATRDAEPLGYVCFGSPAVQAWALRMLAQLAERYGCDWIKLDFNLDPGPGCNRTDHGHGAGDGLFAHYTGYYRTLARFRAGHPGVVLENCSSGGLRGDLGMMRQTHVSFLSDPDWPEHTLQAFWGASMVLAPEVCLRWSWSESAQGSSEKRFDPHDPNLQPHQLDYYIRTALLGAAGFSLRLPDLPDWVRDRIRFHAHLYRERIRRFIRSGDLYRLTDQPRRIGDGERWCAFQLSLPHEHVVFVFRLPGAEPARRVHPQRLDPKMHYLLEWVDGNQSELLPGRDLMENGILVDRLREQDSGIAFVKEHQQT